MPIADYKYQIANIAARCDRLNNQPSQFSVRLESSSCFCATDFTNIEGAIASDHGQMIQGLLDDTTLTLYVSCIYDSESADRRNTRIGMQSPCTLEITVYGPYELFEQIGTWFEDYDIYLQDPRVCQWDVKYCNPQKLSSNDLTACPLLSEVVTQRLGLINLQDMVERPDLLDLISSQDDLDESPQPSLITADMKRHQKQALTFMLRREQGWDFTAQGQDIWEKADTSQDRYYFNHISKSDQPEPPPEFRGGIVADPMGLGKTLTMISLIAHDFSMKDSTVRRREQSLEEKPHVKATLIVVPQPLLGVWEEQLREHVVADSVKFRRHHARARLNDLQDLKAVNIVLTTYQTLSADWRAWKTSDNHIMFSVHWHRIVLDEAHVIRNMKSRMAQAICDLDATSRWAVTGTPIQNNLSDLTALLKFIRAYPYDEPKRFDTDITKLWKSGEDEEAVTRLKRLSRCLILRRAGSTVDLPSRRDTRCAVDFSSSERALYDSIRLQTIAKIDDALLHESELSTSGKYGNFLQQIESMRLICNLGLHYTNRHKKPQAPKSEDWAVLAQEMFNIQRNMGSMTCFLCASVLEHDDTLLDELATQDSPLFSRCLKYACANCSYDLKRTGRKMACGDTSLCPIAPVSISSNALEEMPSHVASNSRVPSTGLPSKIQVLIADLKLLPLDVKWYAILLLVERKTNNSHPIASCSLPGGLHSTSLKQVLTRQVSGVFGSMATSRRRSDNRYSIDLNRIRLSASCYLHCRVVQLGESPRFPPLVSHCPCATTLPLYAYGSFGHFSTASS
jgi:hypothetical protein